MRPATTAAGDDGPAVLWLHGYTMDSSLWPAIWARLPGYRHVGVDLPGHGGSDPLPAGATAVEAAAAIAAIARNEGARSVVALSFGTVVAVQAALDHPDVVDHLVLAAPTVGGAAEESGTRQRYLQLAMLHRMGGGGADLADCWMQAPPDIFRAAQAHPELHERIRDVVARHRWTELRDGGMRGIVRHPQQHRLGSITAATSVLVGSDDLPSTRASAGLLAATVPACAVHEVPGTGHLCLLERPDLTAPLVAAGLAVR